MVDDEVACFVVNLGHEVIVVVSQLRTRALITKELPKISQSRFDHIDASGFERLDKTAGEPDANAVLDPEAVDPPDLHLQMPRGVAALQITNLLAQLQLGRILADVLG